MAATSIAASLFSLFTTGKPPTAPAIKSPSQLSVASSANPERAPIVLANEAHTSHPRSADVMSVVCPSLAYANTLFFRSAYNVQVIVDENEPEERLLGRFRREVMRAGVIQECKRRRFFENKQDEAKRKTREAAKRNRRRRPYVRSAAVDRQESSKDKKGDEDDDNWDLPEGALS